MKKARRPTLRDSYWLDRPYTPAAPLEGEVDVDVAVSGGGITGVTAALFLAEAGARVAVFERREVATGASGRNGGFLLAGTHEYYVEAVEELTDRYGSEGRRYTAAAWHLALENHRLMTEIMTRYDIDCDYRRSGSYIVAMSRPDRGSHPRPVDRIAESYHLMREDGFDVAVLNREAIRDLLKSPIVEGALRNGFDGEIHPVKYVRGVAEAAKKQGAFVFEHTPILSITRDGLQFLLRTAAGQVRADRVLLGMNAYTPQLDESYEKRIVPNRGQVFTTEPISERLFDGVFYANDGWEYWRQLHDGPNGGGRLLFGGSRNHHIPAERGYHFMRRNGRLIKTYRGYRERPTQAVQTSNDRAFDRTFPGLATLERTHRWGGVMGFSYDSSPFVGETDTPGIYVIAGFTGRGNAYATAAARLMTDRLVGRDGEMEERFTRVRSVFDARRGER
ncbi:MAG: FAD-binding oxidoreductase [candidate division Zixibacteria bacterium]|nr:FAD-binding oxidoreductase [candidate division Zixibacteria bacterium]